jgi:hypothetical protein
MGIAVRFTMALQHLTRCWIVCTKMPPVDLPLLCRREGRSAADELKRGPIKSGHQPRRSSSGSLLALHADRAQGVGDCGISAEVVTGGDIAQDDTVEIL